MSGYDEYFSGLRNGIDTQFAIDVSTVTGLDSFKAYLAQHGTGAAEGGIVNFAAGAIGCGTPITSGNYAGKYYVHLWGTSVNHAMTIAGYDDNVLIDYNGDGQYTNTIDINNDTIIDLKDYERGALIVANSWGPGWGNDGFMYMPYRLCALPSSEGGIYASTVFGIKVKIVETPQLVMKVRMKHNRRDLVLIKIGVHEETSALNYLYSLTKNDFPYQRGPYAFLGESSPGVMDNNPITFAFDCTELLKKTDPTKDLKFFLEIMENDASGIGNGDIEYASLMDYRTGTVKETVITGTSEPILNNTITLLSAILPASSPIITATSGSNGSITPSGNLSVNQGSSMSFTIAPASGYIIDAVTVDGVNAGAVSSYTFSNVQGNHSISASFKMQAIPGPAGYTWCAKEGGSFTLPDISDVAYGANGIFVYQNGKSGAITFDNATFGDPTPGVVKNGFYKTSSTSTVGLSYEYYEGTWTSLPDFNALTPKKTGIVSKSGVRTLTAGYHKIELTYFEKSGSEILKVSWAGPGFSERTISARVLYK